MRKVQRQSLYGGQFIQHYFEEKNDELKVHKHPRKDLTHWTLVIEGEFLVLGENEHSGKIIKRGDMCYWDVGVTHGFKALVSPSSLINIRPSRSVEDAEPEAYEPAPDMVVDVRKKTVTLIK